MIKQLHDTQLIKLENKTAAFYKTKLKMNHIEHVYSHKLSEPIH